MSKITRIHDYTDPDFSQIVLNQHGAYKIEGIPVSFEIISLDTARIVTNYSQSLDEVIQAFRLYSPFINKFIMPNSEVITYSPINTTKVSIKDIEVSQFYINEDKLKAIQTWLSSDIEIFLPIIKNKEGKYILTDGHTRLYALALLGQTYINIYEDDIYDYIYDFNEVCKQKNVKHIKDLKVLNSKQYKTLWLDYCEEYFRNK